MLIGLDLGPEVTAAQARDHVTELERERAIASRTRLGEIDVYMDDLAEEIRIWKYLYAVSAVTEIAVLRAELSGPLAG